MANVNDLAKNKIVVIFGLLGCLCVALIVLLAMNNRPATKQPAPLPKEVQVTLSKDGFSPKVVTIAAGSAVRWVNQSGGQASVNSDNYPTNQLYKQLNLGLFQPGSTLALIFNDKGSYGYHDQLHPDFKGTVVVQ